MGKANAKRSATTDVAAVTDISVAGTMLFAAYYKEQGIVPEAEWEKFQEALARLLPLTFKTHVMPSRERSAMQIEAASRARHRPARPVGARVGWHLAGGRCREAGEWASLQRAADSAE